MIIDLSEITSALERIEAKVDQLLNKVVDPIPVPPTEPEQPVPPTEPEQPKEVILFQTDFENGFTNWNNGGEINSSWVEGYGSYGRTTTSVDQAFSGTKSMKIETNGRTPSTWANSFVAQNNNWRYNFAREGDTIRTKLKVFIPNNIGFFYPNGDWGFFNLLQVKGVSADNRINNPLHCLYLESSNDKKTNWFSVGYMGKQWGDSSNVSHRQDKPLNIPIGSWFELDMETYFHDGQGYYKLYQEGTLIFDLQNQRTFRRNGGIDRLDLGICNYHRYASTYINGVRSGNNITIYVDDVIISRL